MTSHLRGHFVNPTTGNQAFVSWLAWDQDLTGLGPQTFEVGWIPGPDVTITNAGVPQPARAGENGFEGSLTGLGAATFDLERMDVSAEDPVSAALTTDVASAITLVGDWDGTPAVTIDGAAVSSSLSGDALTFTLPAGAHEVAVG
jgi:hypothetical protein